MDWKIRFHSSLQDGVQPTAWMFQNKGSTVLVQLWSRESFPQNVFLCESAETVTGIKIIHMLVKTSCLLWAKKCLYKTNQDLNLS